MKYLVKTDDISTLQRAKYQRIVYQMGCGVNGIKPFYGKFTGVTYSGSSYNVRLNGSSSTTSIASGETYEMSVIPTTAFEMFRGCANLTSLDLSSFDTSEITNMTAMFLSCFVFSLDLSNFDTSNVTAMNCMFMECGYITNLNLNSFNTCKVTDMGQMFQNCRNLATLDLSSFDTSNVTNMQDLLRNCRKLRYITLGENFFKAMVVVPFDDAENLGFNEDGTDNGWLEHLATTASRITDGRGRGIKLNSNLKNKPWVGKHFGMLQSKGFTIV